ncbi:MAG: TetR family transcriptional regulator [Actinomycetota bacterium]|nr:TetR family transcriptional regulator [Actinomycetota bacterium]
MPYDAAATRSRLIEAAVVEFAAFGLAGARVDRIATVAAANKRAIYDYFSNKEGLFDAALTHVIGNLIEAVPLREDDLPGYAAELFDYLQEHPEAVRMLSWRRLERPEAGPHIADTLVEGMTKVGERSHADNHEHAIDPVDLVILTIGLANAWHLSAPDLLANRGPDPANPERIATHRSAVIEATRRLSDAS